MSKEIVLAAADAARRSAFEEAVDECRRLGLHDAAEAIGSLAQKPSEGCEGSVNDVRCWKRPAPREAITGKLLCESHRESVENIAAIFKLLEEDRASS